MNKTTSGKVNHPAKYSQALMPALASSLVGCKTVLDPFAGTGRIHELNGYAVEPSDGALHNLPNRVPPLILNLETYGIEIALDRFLDLPFTNSSFDAICTSPVSDSLTAGHHDAQGTSSRNTGTHTLERTLSPNWGEAYRQFHLKAWSEAIRVLRPGGRFVLDVKDHTKGDLTEWHVGALAAFGLVLVAKKSIPTPAGSECVIVFFKKSDQLSEALSSALEQRSSESTHTPVAGVSLKSYRRDRTFNEFLVPDQRANKRNRK